MKRRQRFLGQAAVVSMFLFIGLIAAGAWLFTSDPNDQATFDRWLAQGTDRFAAGDLNAAIDAFQQCLALNPTNPEIHHNLACCFLQTRQWDQALTHATEVLQIVPGDPSALYLAGCALVRRASYSNAVQCLNQLAETTPPVAAVQLELGRAYRGWNRLDAAATEYREALRTRGDLSAAQSELAETLAPPGPTPRNSNPPVERCRYNEIVTASEFEQPLPKGIPIRFTDSTPTALGLDSTNYTAICQPLGLAHSPAIDLLASRRDNSLVVLRYTNGVLRAIAPSIRSIVGHINALVTAPSLSDTTTEALVLGETGTQALRIGSDGNAVETGVSSGLEHFSGRAAAFAILDPGGQPTLLGVDANGAFHLFDQTIAGDSNSPRVAFRERGPLPEAEGKRGISDVLVEDLNNDGRADVVLLRASSSPQWLLNQGGHGLAAVPNRQDWPSGTAIALGDLNNDKRIDAVIATENSLNLFYGGRQEARRLPARRHGLTHFRLIDYDQDGWLDIVGWGKTGLRVWRNRGWRGFHEVTMDLGFAPLAGVPVETLTTADFDNDGDSDWLLGLTNGGLRYWRNDGANSHGLLKLRPTAPTSSALVQGLRVEIDAGNWHAVRTIGPNPSEIGLGQHTNLALVSVRDSTRHWSRTNLTVVSRRILEVPMSPSVGGAAPTGNAIPTKK